MCESNDLTRCSESTQKGWVKDRVALNSIEAISFVRERGIPMSKSRLYKLTAQKQIPFRKAGERLVFSIPELEDWCEGQLTDPFSGKGEAVTLIVKSAQRQSSINKLNN